VKGHDSSCRIIPLLLGPGPEAPKLLHQVRTRLLLKHYSLRTEAAYVGWIRRYILFHDRRHPREMGKREAEAFLSALAVEGKVWAAGWVEDGGRYLSLG
jgi:integrase-like protein